MFLILILPEMKMPKAGRQIYFVSLLYFSGIAIISTYDGGDNNSREDDGLEGNVYIFI